MRLSRADQVGGMPATLARELMRRFTEPQPESCIDSWIETDGRTGGEVARVFADAGYLTAYSVDRDGVTWWESTIAGSALAQASFRAAITRATAERHLAGVIERAKKINADESYLVDVTELIVFGSYLDSEVQDLGDLDLGVALRSRVLEVPSTAEQREVVLKYVRACGQRTGNLLVALAWPEKEALKILGNGSAVIHLTLEDVRALTDRWEVVYSYARPEGYMTGTYLG